MATVKRISGPAKKQLKIMTEGLDGVQGRVGWFESAKYEDGTPVASVAVVQEFGSPKMKIPPRSFMRTTIAERKIEWSDIIKTGARLVVAGQAPVKLIMESLALQASGDIRKKITEIWTPPLKPATVAARLRRKSDRKTVGNLEKPLIDTGHMITTLGHEVSKS